MFDKKLSLYILTICDKIKNMIENIKFNNAQTSFDAIQNNSLNLAFIGDAVWSLLVREYFLYNTQFKNNNLHKLTTKFVKATYQAKALDILQVDLTDLEKDIARRARNVKMNTVAKNAPLADYKKATSFEAVIGYLYLTNSFDRIKEFFNKLSISFLEDRK